MKIALIGYGKMGHEIEAIALERGHTIELIIDQNNSDQLNEHSLANIDVAIEFTTPDSAFENVMTCLKANKPVVSGTTGWLHKLDEAKAFANAGNGALFNASNYSIGVNIFFLANKILASYLNKTNNYKASICEIHHTQKKDAPSGTAISLAKIIENEMSKYIGWSLLPEIDEPKIPIEAIREGSVPGTHVVTYSSAEDEITFTHKAKSRKGFALGAVIAAEYSYGKKGFLTMDSLLDID
jgi:4-hydroxy-tetrahydrodipicolinate reductase